MSKILFFTDPHIKGTNPSKRIDNYQESLFAKFQEVGKIAKREKAEYIICGGDLFDAPSVSLNVANRFITEIESWDIPFHTVIGNHDCLMGDNRNGLLPYTIDRSSKINLLNVIETIDSFIVGDSYFFGIEERNKGMGLDINDRLQTPLQKTKQKYKILVTHSNILDRPGHPSMPHVVYNEIDCNYDLLLIGHYHPYCGVKEYNGTKYVWIGALSRGTIGQSDLNRTPKVLIIDTETKNLKEIELKCAKSVDEIFDLSKLNEHKESEKRLEDFIMSIQDINFKSMNLRERIEEIGKSNKIEESLIDEITRRL